MNKTRTILLLSTLVATAFTASAALTVTLTPNPPSPAPVGTSITWTATVRGDPDPAPAYVYKFTAEIAGQPRVTRTGFMRSREMVWTPSNFDGNFTVDVVVKNLHAGTSGQRSANYTITSRLIGGTATINPTANPLVALFSGPACQVPNAMRVRFFPVSVPPGAISTPMTTSTVPCRFDTTAVNPDESSMNFQIAGLYPQTTYQMRWEVVKAGSTLEGTYLSYSTGPIPGSVTFPTFTPTGNGSASEPIVLHSPIQTSASAATDLAGHVLWYTTNIPPVRTQIGGRYLGTVGSDDPYLRGLREVDLAGNTTIETSVGDVNEQLAAMSARPVTSIHHETRRMYRPGGGAPNGYILALSSTEFAVTSAGQCGLTGSTPNTCDVIGDQILVFDSNLNVKWAWDLATHLDTDHAAVLGEKCTNPLGTAGCPPFTNPFPSANDWTHSNSLQYTAYDGNIIISIRHQDSVLKINYADGAGDGRILWRLGSGTIGDQNGNPLPTFAVATNNTGGQHDIGFPMQSHQHDPEIEYGGFLFPGGFRVLTLYDNGNTRHANFNNQGHSRCQLYAISEDQLIANLNVNADLGVYSQAVGEAQMLANGNMACDSGIISGSTPTQSTENTQAGDVVYSLSVTQPNYRTFRMRDMFTPVNP